MACYDPDNIYIWYYIIFNLKDTPYEGGYYLGKIVFPDSYPHKPPSIEMTTPNGRFKERTKICMSISNHHPESWNPAWNMRTIVIGLISFMLSDDHTMGSIHTSDDQKRTYAKGSLANCLERPVFNELFKESLKIKSN